LISKQLIRDTVVKLFRQAVTSLPRDVECALEKAYKWEKSKISRIQLNAILENVKLAGKCSIPMCQDTGIPLVYVKIGEKTGVKFLDLRKSIAEGIKLATKEIPLRPNIVHPLSRKNTGDNTGISRNINIEILPEKDYIDITVFPKGAGSENMSFLKMLNPSDGIDGIKKFVLESVVKAAGNPCPPTIVGIGIGGSSDIAMKLAKTALLRPLKEKNKDNKIASLEKELLEKINSLGIGPMGLGGRTTALKVNIEYEYCHTASLPVAINMGCWANRYSTARIYKNRVIFPK